MNGYAMLGQAQMSGITDTLEQSYQDLRNTCIDNYGPDFCNTVLPRNLVYAVTRKDQRAALPWWGWLLIGGIVGRVLR